MLAIRGVNGGLNMYLPILRRIKAHSPCPGCGLHNNLDLDSCKHCGRTFSAADKQEIMEYAERQRAKGTRMGMLVAGTFLVVLLLSYINSG